jgi:hypothetical protein
VSADVAAVKADTAAVLIDTADMQPKLGTPVASLAADIATVDSNVDAILVDTADMQPKLGTPAGASMSADIAAVKVDTAATLVDTGTTLPATLGSPAGADMSADIAAVKAETASILTDTGTTIPATITTAQNDLDTLTGSDGALIATGQTATAWSALEASAGEILEGTAAATGLSTTTMDTNLTNADDSLNGRILIFEGNATAALAGRATDITDYANTNGAVTFTAVPVSPANTDRFVVI